MVASVPPLPTSNEHIMDNNDEEDENEDFEPN